jgi:hypothetical protein|tara:strand:+ start:187 stop:621 length:435 start_codon:yes stop_codon:yes gene_type:complete
MAKVYTGRDGQMQVHGVTIAKVVSFQLSSNVDMLETTTLNDNLRSYTPGITGYSGSATLLYYKDDDGNFNTEEILSRLFKADSVGTRDTDDVELTFNWIDGSNKRHIKMVAFITSANIGAATGEIVRAEISFQGTGALNAVAIS